MVTKSTANSKAKKESAQRKEAYRQIKPCAWCSAPLNTIVKFFGHTKAVCQAIQKNNKQSNPKEKSETTK